MMGLTGFGVLLLGIDDVTCDEFACVIGVADDDTVVHTGCEALHLQWQRLASENP